MRFEDVTSERLEQTYFMFTVTVTLSHLSMSTWMSWLYLKTGTNRKSFSLSQWPCNVLTCQPAAFIASAIQNRIIFLLSQRPWAIYMCQKVFFGHAGTAVLHVFVWDASVGVSSAACFLVLDMLCLNRLVGLVVKASASRAEDPGFDSRFLHGDCSGSTHTSDLKSCPPVATPTDVWRYMVSAETGWPVSVYCDWLI